jgi:hypothetical protein
MSAQVEQPVLSGRSRLYGHDDHVAPVPAELTGAPILSHPAGTERWVTTRAGGASCLRSRQQRGAPRIARCS